MGMPETTRSETGNTVWAAFPHAVENSPCTVLPGRAGLKQDLPELDEFYRKLSLARVAWPLLAVELSASDRLR
jgi:hypothetical protein